MYDAKETVYSGSMDSEATWNSDMFICTLSGSSEINDETVGKSHIGSEVKV